MTNTVMDQRERALVQHLRAEPRAPMRSLAVALGESENTVARRYRRLVERGDLRVFASARPPGARRRGTSS